MKLYNRSGESFLYERIKSFGHVPEGWRAIHFNFDKLDAQYQEGVRSHVVVNIIKDLLRAEEGLAYLCESGDVFLLFQGPVQPVLDKLGEYVAGLVPDLRRMVRGIAQNEDQFCTIYDLGFSWKVFSDLCAEKYQQACAAKKAKAVRVTTEDPAKPQEYPLHTEHFANMVINRAMREETVALVVEDDAFTRRLVCNSLKGVSQFHEAGDGQTALDKYALVAPDIVFLDIELPDTNGHILLQQFIAADPDAFVIMLSGNSQKENVIAALEDGAQGFITKPFAKEKLLHYLRAAQQTKAQRVVSIAKSNPNQTIAR